MWGLLCTNNSVKSFKACSTNINFWTLVSANDFAIFSKWASQLIFSVCNPLKDGIKFSKSVNEIPNYAEFSSVVLVVNEFAFSPFLVVRGSWGVFYNLKSVTILMQMFLSLLRNLEYSVQYWFHCHRLQSLTNLLSISILETFLFFFT